MTPIADETPNETPVSGLDQPAVSEAEAQAAIAADAMPDAINDPVKEFIYLPGKGHSTANVMEFYMMAVFRLVGLAPPAPGALRYVKIPEDYARALSPETQAHIRQLQPAPVTHDLPEGMSVAPADA